MINPSFWLRRSAKVPTGLFVACVAVTAACGSTAAPEAATAATVAPVVALSPLPAPLSEVEPVPTLPARTTPPTTTMVAPNVDLAGNVADFVTGNRVLLIGDSVLASTSPRFGGALCDVLTKFGWTAEIDAEEGRFVEFAGEVLDARLDVEGEPDWDVVVMFLGNNYRGDFLAFRDAYNAVLERIAPRPVIIYTVTEVEPDRVALNDFIRSRPLFHPNIVVVDWAEITAADPDKLLTDDGLHLSEEGRGRLGIFTVAALGEAPPTIGEPACLPTAFTDDSAG